MNTEIFTIIGWIVCSTAGLAVALTFLGKIMSRMDW